MDKLDPPWSLAAAFSCIALSACTTANWDSIYRHYEVDETDKLQSVLIDAKQRAIISKRLPSLKGVIDADGKPARLPGDTVVCAEPSPDVFTAISQSFATTGSLSGTSKEAQLALSYALAESAGELRRARTIQLLRDSLFNTCLGYMNGALQPVAYERLLNKYADETLTLLAVEQITPQSVTAPLTLTSESPNGTAGNSGRQSISNQSPSSGDASTGGQHGTTGKPASATGAETPSLPSGNETPGSGTDSGSNTLERADGASGASNNESATTIDTKALGKALSDKASADSDLRKANVAVTAAESEFMRSPTDAAAAMKLKAALSAKAQASTKADKAGQAASQLLANATKTTSPLKTAKNASPAPGATPSGGGTPAVGNSGNPQNNQQPDLVKAPYPSGENVQSLAPPTNAAVIAVQNMVQVFLNNTLTNKCLDDLNQQAEDRAASAIDEENLQQQRDYSYYLINQGCFEVLNTTLPSASGEGPGVTENLSSQKTGKSQQSGSQTIPNAPPKPAGANPPGTAPTPPPKALAPAGKPSQLSQ